MTDLKLGLSFIFRGLLAGAVLASFYLTHSAVANAHSQAVYYHSEWAGASPTIGWKFAPNFPSGSAKADRVKDSFNEWDSHNANFTINFNGVAENTYNYQNPCNGGYNGIFQPTSGVNFGETHLCGPESGHTITRASLAMEQGTDSFWDTGDNDTGTNKYVSVVTHEAGHFTGFGTLYYETQDPDDMHFPFANTSGGICWDDSDFQTMCSGLVPAPIKTSSLEEHDIHTFQDAY